MFTRKTHLLRVPADGVGRVVGRHERDRGAVTAEQHGEEVADRDLGVAHPVRRLGHPASRQPPRKSVVQAAVSAHRRDARAQT